jgi:hypothetical protein
MRIGTRVAPAAALALSALLAVACGSGSDHSEPAIGAIRTVTTTSELVLPLDAYGLGTKEYGTVTRAAWHLARACLRRFGSEYTLPEAALTSSAPNFEHPNERRYGLYDPESAGVRGYNVAPEQRPPIENVRTFAWNPSEAELLLVRGPGAGATGPPPPLDLEGRPLPDGGCRGEADRILAGGAPVPANDNLPNELAHELFKKAEADSRVRAAMVQWSGCMARAGYTYATIWEPNDRRWPEEASEEEIATAKADVRCKRETNLVGTWFTVETAYQQQVIDERAEELAAVQTYSRSLAANAARVLSGG